MVLEFPCLLITDDNRDFRETLREVFEPRGYRTLLAGDGEQALEIVRHESVHVLLMDMHMPHLTGLETWRQVREIQTELPCILVSAALDSAIEEEARQCHIFSVLAKPLRVAHLTAIVQQAMRVTYNWPQHDN